MTRVAMLLLLACSLRAQSGALTLGSGVVGADGTVTLALQFTPGGASAPAGLQWTLTYPALHIVSVAVAPGPAAVAAGKTITCAAKTGAYACVADGINQNTLAAGTVALVTFTMSPGAGAVIGLAGTLGATLGGDAYPVSGTGGTISAGGGSGLLAAPANLSVVIQ